MASKKGHRVTPHADLDNFWGFWGSRRVIWGPITMVRASNER
jgi:hypothetical protein